MQVCTQCIFKFSADNYMDLKFYLEDLLGKKVHLIIVENIKMELKDEILGNVKYA